MTAMKKQKPRSFTEIIREAAWNPPRKKEKPGKPVREKKPVLPRGKTTDKSAEKLQYYPEAGGKRAPWYKEHVPPARPKYEKPSPPPAQQPAPAPAAPQPAPAAADTGAAIGGFVIGLIIVGFFIMLTFLGSTSFDGGNGGSGYCSSNSDCSGFGARHDGRAFCSSDRLCHLCYESSRGGCISSSTGCDANSYPEQGVCLFKRGGRTFD
jgi:hypothetical protein